MKKLLSTILIVTASLLATNLTAQEQTESARPQMLPIIMPCGKSQNIFDLLQGEKYKESPIALGMGTIYMPSGQPANGQLTLWYNADPAGKKNFSVVITLANTDISCILSSGVQMELIQAVWGTPT